MPALMIQGCTSWAGKSLLTAALCHWFARQGVRVAPFKSQNMSNNARVVDGGEIGVAQWLQARAAGIEPDVRMNPVLLKPEAGGSQVVRMGKVDHELSRRAWEHRSAALWPTIDAALQDLRAEYDVVVIEGAGSPAEINLAANDVVNMRVAEAADAPVLLTVDIDRGGAFAHLYGTWMMLPERHRHRVRGFILNRFRGDARLLEPGPTQLQRLTDVPTIGVVPMLDHDLPDEDGAATRPRPRGGLPRVAVVRYPTASNLDELRVLDQVADVRWVASPAALDGADLIILPGSKHVAADLAWLRRTGLDDAIRTAASAHVRVLGICGGLQLLGTRLDDPDGVDGSGPALGLLPLTTTYDRDKHARQREIQLPAELTGPWRAIAGQQVHGYEIRHGRTVVHGEVDAQLEDALVVASGSVVGWYLHGLLEDPRILQALLGTRPHRTLDDTFTALGDAVEAHLDTDLIHRLVDKS